MNKPMLQRRAARAAAALSAFSLSTVATAQSVPAPAAVPILEPEAAPICLNSFTLRPAPDSTQTVACQLSIQSRSYAHALRAGDLATVVVIDGTINGLTVGLATRMARTADGLCTAGALFMQDGKMRAVQRAVQLIYRDDHNPATEYQSAAAMQAAQPACGQRFFDAVTAMTERPEAEVPKMLDRAQKFTNARKDDLTA